MLARKWLLVFGNKLISFASGIFVTYFVARGLGPSRYGILGFGLSFVGVFSAIGDLGFDSAHIKKISEKKEIGSFLGTFFTIKAALNVIFITVVLASVYFVKRFKGGFESPAHEYIIYIALAATGLQIFLDCFLLTFDARLEVAKSQVIAFISLLVSSVLSIIIAVTLRNVLALAAVSIVSNLISLILAAVFFKGYKMTLPGIKQFKEYSRFAFPLMLTTVITSLYYYADRLFIQMFWPSEQVGYYYGAQKFSTFLLMISQTMIYLLFARMSNLHANNDYAALKSLCLKSERYLSLAVTPLVIFLIIFARPMVSMLLGKEFASSAPVLQLLLVQTLMATLSRPAAVVILGVNKPHIQTIMSAFLLPFTLFLYLLFIPPAIFNMRMLGLGAAGAALSLAVTSVLGAIITRIVVYRLIKALPYWRVMLHIAFAISAGLAALYVRKLFFVEAGFGMLFIFALNCLIYLALLVVFREVGRGDYKFILETINFRGMANYIKTELKAKG